MYDMFQDCAESVLEKLFKTKWVKLLMAKQLPGKY